MDRHAPLSAVPEPRPEAQIAALNARLMELDRAVGEIATTLADLETRVVEMERRERGQTQGAVPEAPTTDGAS